MTIHPFYSTILLLLLHLSDNHSINTSICAPIQQFISSFYLPIIRLSIICPSIHPNTHTFSAISFQQLHQDFNSAVFSALYSYNSPYVSLPNRQTRNRWAFRSIPSASCNHSFDSIVWENAKYSNREKQLKTVIENNALILFDGMGDSVDYYQEACLWK